MTTPPDFPQPVTGPAYGPFFRVLATAMLLAVLAVGLRSALGMPPGEGAAQGYLVISLGVLGIFGSYWVLMASTTTIDSTGIRQGGLIEKKVSWHEVRSARAFGPAFARRLIVRTLNGRIRFFFCGSPELHAAFDRVSQAYRR